MKVFKRKQIVVLSLVLMIVIAGYLQYSYKKSSSSISEKENGRLGEAVYVDNMEESSELANKSDGNKEDQEDKKDQKNKKEVAASKHANDFFTQARLDREVMRSRDADALKEISEDPGTTNELKAEAYDQMMKIVDHSQMETKIETLVKEKGFEDVLAIFAEDGSLDIVVKAPSLTSAQTAQIADIAIRHANMNMDQIHIRNIY